jgi:hypothetical protein
MGAVRAELHTPERPWLGYNALQQLVIGQQYAPVQMDWRWKVTLSS